MTALAVEPTLEQLRVGREMRAKARKGWYRGDQASLERYGARRIEPGATCPELAVSLTLSRDRMHHSVGWWRNAEYEYCWHLSMAAKAWEALALVDGTYQEQWSAAPFEQIPRSEAAFWGRVIFGEHVDKLWNEPGGTDPRLTVEEARAHATMWHLRLFLDPETFEPFIPSGEVYDLTRWIDGLTPAKVDR